MSVVHAALQQHLHKIVQAFEMQPSPGSAPTKFKYILPEAGGWWRQHLLLAAVGPVLCARASSCGLCSRCLQASGSPQPAWQQAAALARHHGAWATNGIPLPTAPQPARCRPARRLSLP
jgi:hypothetical protein